MLFAQLGRKCMRRRQKRKIRLVPPHEISSFSPMILSEGE